MTTYCENENLEILLERYNNQMDLVKEKLLNGANWESLSEHRDKITELAASICKLFPANTTHAD